MFGFWDVKNEDDQSTIQKWFHKKWEIINNSPWLTLPEKVIEWIIKIKNASSGLGNKLLKLTNKDLFIYFFVFVVCVILFFGASFLWGLTISIIALIPLILYVLNFKKISKNMRRLPFIFYVFYMSFIIFKTILTTNIYYASIIMLLIMPFSFSLFFIPLGLILIVSGTTSKENTNSFAANISTAMAISFFITFLAISIGHIIIPTGWVPQTFQMLISNVLLDGFTLLATFYILEEFVKPPYLIRIPLAITVDLFVAAVFACASLYFGLVGTEQALTIPQILNILMFKSPNGGSLEFGPFFWTMHTTFIPTVIYLFIILLCWLAKLMLQPIHLFFDWARIHNHPLRLTAALCVIFVAVFTALSFAAATAEEKLKQDIKIQSHSVSTQPPP